MKHFAKQYSLATSIPRELHMQDTPPKYVVRNLELFDVLGEAWALTSGIKLSIWIPLMLAGLIGVLSGALFHFLSTVIQWKFAAFILPLWIVVAVYLLIYLGCCVVKTSITIARVAPVTIASAFSAFSQPFWPLFATIFLAAIALLPGVLLARAGASWLGFFYDIIVGPLVYMSIPLIVDCINSPLVAISLSFKSARAHWLTLIGLFLMKRIIFGLISYAAIALFVLYAASKSDGIIFLGLVLVLFCIRVVPFIYVMQGVVYHKLFD